MKCLVCIILLCGMFFVKDTLAETLELSLYNSSGKAVAYLAPSDEFTLYLWSGEPVAYIDAEDASAINVYGFNGNHLGWFKGGVIFDHTGKVACATKENLHHAEYEEYKSFKEFKPFKEFKESPPFQPSLSTEFSELGCEILLSSGAK